jgi:Bacterial protein of unknown function (DUF922)
VKAAELQATLLRVIGKAGLALLLFASACARLPDYAMPRVEVVEAAQLAKADGISYRKLTRGDFRAKRPPIANADHAAQVSAFTCANVVPKGKLQMELRQRSAEGGFDARITRASFIAKMDRNCSWWNPALSSDASAHILQHEQIHFAIAEVAARDLTRRVRQLSASGDSPEQTTAALQRAIDDVFRDAMHEMTERNIDFDRETSGRHDPELQQRWYDQVTGELAR